MTNELLGLEAVELLRAMIGRRSVSGEGIREVLELIVEGFGAPGWRVHVDEDARFALITPEDGAELLFACHADTVPFKGGEWEHHPLSGELVGDRVFGRGAADMKGGLAAAAVALAAAGPGRAGLLVTDDEEVGCLGARAALPALRDQPIRAILIPEPTSNQACLGHRGAMTVEVSAVGQAAHASVPELGRNAIVGLMVGLQTLTAFEVPDDAHPLGRVTHAITGISGGTGRNVVPDAARATIDFRFREASEADGFLDFLRERTGLQVEVLVRLDAVSTSEQDPWVQSLPHSERGFGVAPFFTDGSVFKQLGPVPIVVMGPGESSAAHVVDESVSVGDIHRAVELYLGIIRDFDATHEKGGA